MVDVLVIVVTQAEELLYMLDACWNRPLLDGLKLGWIYANTEPALTMCPRYSTDYCRKEHFFSLAQRCLSYKMLEDYMEMGKMVAKQLTEHQDIIQVYDHEVVKKAEKSSDASDAKKQRGCWTIQRV